jgi:vacuolar protein sorting-associated protein 26
MAKNYSSNTVKEQDFIVQKVDKPPDSVAPIKMEVGIEECLHIEFEYDKQRCVAVAVCACSFLELHSSQPPTLLNRVGRRYHLQDIIIGKVYFLLVRIKIKHMELNIIRREQAGSGQQQNNESETLVKYELMDGAPVRGECIPIRLFMSSLDLTPTYKNTSHKFSVKYYLNLVLVDQEDRRYFKQQEVILWRKDIG